MEPDRKGKSQPDNEGCPDVAQYKCQRQSSTTPLQFRQRKNAHQARKPQVDRTGVSHECAADEGAQMPLVEIVQVGTRVGDDPVLHPWALYDQHHGDSDQGRRVADRHA
ncbi:Uncharacterised protein [Mycobacteroides abscessus subsp. abscessus]|nr:Uncharacterised protein [Mycobacteroides abscessus subsp. abscessus]